MGFNSIRLYGLYRFVIKNDSLYIKNIGQTKNNIILILDNINPYISIINQVIDSAKANDLRIMFCVGDNVTGTVLEDTFLVKVLTAFNKEFTIFSYDFFNEPLYFDKVHDREKLDALKLVKKWRKMMDKYAPNQLMTIGFSEPIEVFEWDAEILPVDFLAFHVYNPLRIPNEIYWYSHYVHKPWVIGETGLAADNDSVSYERQSAFIKQTYQYALNCGASGFGLWQFQDVSWGLWRQNYKGLLSSKGTTTVDGFTVNGSLKPASNIIKELPEMKPDKSCNRPGNYFNMRDYHQFLVTGKVVSEKTGQPIEGAVIRGWSKNWRWGTNTYTDSSGVFYLYCNKEFVHFRISAPTYDRIHFDFQGNYKLTEAGKHPEQHPDSMQRRIRNFTGNKFYDYNPKDFYYAFKKADMGTKKLPKL